MGRKREPRQPNESQREFVNGAWLAGMPRSVCIGHITRKYGENAAVVYVTLLYKLRADQMLIFEAARKEMS